MDEIPGKLDIAAPIALDRSNLDPLNSFLPNLTPNLKLAIIGIFAILVLANVISFVLKKIKPGINLTNVDQRIKSWWVMAGVFCLAMVVHQKMSIVFLCLVSIAALWEMFKLVGIPDELKSVKVLIYLLAPVQFLFVWIQWYGMFIIFVPVYMLLLISTFVLLTGDTKDYIKNVTRLHWSMMFTVFSISHASYLLALPKENNPNGGAAGLLLFLVVCTQLNDVAQFLWGKTIGGKKVVPTVSPGKSWAGLIGGVCTTTLVAFLIGPMLTPMDAGFSALAGFIIGATGFLGDINISAIKRDMGVKDSSQLIPGHGGLLDRLDSLTFTAPLFFHFLVYFYY